ncbi:MAG: type II secretion system secretin GspD [bacterium]
MKKIFTALIIILIIISSICPLFAAQKKSDTPKIINDKVTMDFDNVDIRLVIKFISDLTNKNFIIDDSIKGTVTIISPSPIPLDEAYRVFESILEIKGFAAVPSGNTVKIVPARQAPERNIEMRTEPEMSDGVQNDAIVTQLIPIENSKASQITKVIQPLIPKDSKMILYEPTNTIILIDTISNISRLIKIIEQIDVSPAEVIFKLVELKYAPPGDISKEIQSVITQIRSTGSNAGKKRRPRNKSKGDGAIEPKIIPDARTGSLILVGIEEDIELIMNLIKKLDVETPKSQDNIRVHFLKNSKADDIAATLTKIASQQKSTKGSTPGAVAPLIENTQIVADKSTNSLIITASPQDYTTLRRIIDELDVMRPQVLVEALIAEVKFNKNQDLGVDWRAIEPPDEGDDYKGFAGTNFGKVSSVQNLQPPAGLFLGVMKGTISLGGMELPNIAALIQAYQSDNDVNILSTPHILTLDNEAAQILIGDDVPIQQTEIVDNRTINSTTYKAVGIALQITPHINPDGYIKLELSLKIDKVNREVESGVWTTRREAKTIIMVKDTETIVIGGLLQDDKQKGFSRVPCLGEIPFLGWFFRSMFKSSIKTNLQVFITPHIVKSPEELNVLTNDRGSSLGISDFNATTESNAVLENEKPQNVEEK